MAKEIEALKSAGLPLPRYPSEGTDGCGGDEPGRAIAGGSCDKGDDGSVHKVPETAGVSHTTSSSVIYWEDLFKEEGLLGQKDKQIEQLAALVAEAYIILDDALNPDEKHTEEEKARARAWLNKVNPEGK
jgi:hypothetical protein